MSNIIDIHIQRNVAGAQIPFDKLYLMKPDQKELLPKIFGYAIVMPLSEDIKEVIYKLNPSALTKAHFRRNDDDKAVPLALDKQRVLSWWKDFNEEYDIDNRLVVIPVLTSLARRKIRPRYLANKKWFAANVQRQRTKQKNLPQSQTVNALSDYAYLATPLDAPQDKIRPLCSICPRMLRHIQGDCLPGQPVCYDALNFADIVQAKEPTDASLQHNDNQGN